MSFNSVLSVSHGTYQASLTAVVKQLEILSDIIKTKLGVESQAKTRGIIDNTTHLNFGLYSSILDRRCRACSRGRVVERLDLFDRDDSLHCHAVPSQMLWRREHTHGHLDQRQVRRTEPAARLP